MRIVVTSAEETQAFGFHLGECADVGLVIIAEGSLGAGKTTLAQGVARGLAVPPDHYVNSPTFAIAQVHPGRLSFYHLDLYRIGDFDEAMGLGLEEMLGTDGVAYVEWPSRCIELIPDDHLSIKITVNGTDRTIDISANGPRSRSVLQRVCTFARD